jgi:Uncharacterized conserved protein (DUF2358)
MRTVCFMHAGFVGVGHVVWPHRKWHLEQSIRNARQRPATVSLLTDPLEREKHRVLTVLTKDLIKQYKAPFEMDFSIYSPKIKFTDPITRLPHSRLLYKGMIFTIAAVIALLFRPGSAQFVLEECKLEQGDEECPVGRIVTRFCTKASTRWSSPSDPPLEISGVDRFWLETNPQMNRVQISYHESLWDQTPEKIRKEFLR